jgi:hypothetical protein
MTLRRTLLELTKDVLVTLDGDDVSSILDTVESRSVADIIKQCYRTIISNTEQPVQMGPFNLTETSSLSPSRMLLPNTILNIEWLKYDTRPTVGSPSYFSLVEYQEPEMFFDNQSRRASDLTSNGVYSYTVPGFGTTTNIYYGKVNHPRYYTILHDPVLPSIFFDSILVSLDAFAKTVKTSGWGEYNDSWNHVDTFTPRLDDKQFELLFQMARSQANVDLKQAANADAISKVKTARVSFNRNKHGLHGQTNQYYNSDLLPNYGRK